MAVRQHQPFDEFQHLRIEAAETRLRGIRSQIAIEDDSPMKRGLKVFDELD